MTTKYFIIIFVFLFIPVNAFAYESYGFLLTGNPKDGWILTFPEGTTYYMDWIKERLRTASIDDGTCYFYNGQKTEQCTLQEYSSFLGQQKKNFLLGLLQPIS